MKSELWSNFTNKMLPLDTPIQDLVHYIDPEIIQEIPQVYSMNSRVLSTAINTKYDISALFDQNGEIPQPNIDFFNPQMLGSFLVDDIVQLINLMKINALQSGFSLTNLDGSRETRARLCCEFGGRKSKGNAQRKTCCPFNLYIKHKYVNGSLKYFISEKSILFHNRHPFEPTNYLANLSPENVRNQILHYGKTLTPTQIQQIMCDQYHFTTLDIEMILNSAHFNNFSLETEALINFVLAENGIVRTFEKIEHGIKKRLAVLTIMPHEIDNIMRYSSILEIDGTQLPYNSLKWEMTPITFMDNYKKIKSGGIMFSATMNHEVIVWLFNQMLSIPQFKIETIVTDEDSAFLPDLKDIKSMNPNVILNHILCAKHKTSNFEMKLQKTSLSKAEKEKAKYLFLKVCYSNSRYIVEQSLQSLLNFNFFVDYQLKIHIMK